MIVKNLLDSKGFAAAVFVFFVVILCVLALAASLLMQSEGFIFGETINTVQVDYALHGVASFAMQKIRITDLDELDPFSVGGINVYMDTTQTTDYDANVLLTVNAQSDNFNQSIKIYINLMDKPLTDYAIFVSGYVTNVRVQDGDPDTLLVEEAEIPEIAVFALYDTAFSQGRVVSSSFNPPDDYPDKDFWENPTTPCVTYIEGDLNVTSSSSIYGIYIVEGDVYVENGATIEGFVYMVNEGTEVWMHRSAKINGGIVGYCNVAGSALGGLMSKVRYRPVYMAAFESYRTGEMKPVINKETWVYE